MRPKLYYEYSTDENVIRWHGECPNCGGPIGIALVTPAPTNFDTTTLKLICPHCRERFEFDKVCRDRKVKHACVPDK